MENQFSTHLLKILHLGRQYFIQVPIFLQNILPLKSWLYNISSSQVVHKCQHKHCWNPDFFGIEMENQMSVSWSVWVWLAELFKNSKTLTAAFGWVNNCWWGWQNRTGLEKCTHLYSNAQGTIKHKRFQQSSLGVRREIENNKRRRK